MRRTRSRWPASPARRTGRGAPVLPHERPVPGPAGAPVPHHHGLPLVGDADGGDGLAVEAADQLGQRGLGRGPDVVGVVLDQPGRREVLGELAVGVPGGRAVGPQAKLRTPSSPRRWRSPRTSGGLGGPPGRSVGSRCMKVAMLTGGGDCPGLNAVMRAVVRKGERSTATSWSACATAGGGRSRTTSTELDGRVVPGHAAPRRHHPRLVAHQPLQGRRRPRGGQGDPGRQRHRRAGRHRRRGHPRRRRPAGAEGVPVVGVPKTIDNDLSATELTFGFDTAVQVCVDAIDRLHTTAESHDRVMVVEVMGRHAGHIATWAAIAGGATMVLIPERAVRHRRGVPGHPAPPRARPLRLDRGGGRGRVPAEGTLSAVASGEVDAFGHARLGGIGDRLAEAIEERTGYETRAIVLGHVQRGGTPTAFDRVLATRFGIAAIDAVHDGDFGSMVALRPARSCGCRWPRRRPSSSWSTPTSTRSPRCSSADGRRRAAGSGGAPAPDRGARAPGPRRRAPRSRCRSRRRPTGPRGVMGSSSRPSGAASWGRRRSTWSARPRRPSPPSVEGRSSPGKAADGSALGDGESSLVGLAQSTVSTSLGVAGEALADVDVGHRLVSSTGR